MVLGLIAKMLMTGQLKMDGGIISLKGITMNLLPSFFAAELTKYFEKEKKIPEFYFLCWYWGFVLVGEVKRQLNLKTPDEVYSVGMDLGEAMGIGLYKTHDYYPGKFTHFYINSPYLKFLNYPERKKALDFFICGCMGGGGCHVHNAICQNIELKCQLEGAEKCEFITGTEEELKKRGLWSTVVKRYNLKKIYPLQKEIFENYDKSKEEELLVKIIDKL